MVTVAPTAPLVGEKLVMTGVARTVKLEPLVAVTPEVVTEIGPVEAPTGTITVSVVEVAPVTVAAVPLNSTTLLDGVVLKLVPVIVTVAPTAPLVGEKLVIVGGASTSKLDALVTVTPLDITLIGPSEADAGTTATMVVALAEVTEALTPLNCTTGEAPKLVPVTVTEAPGAPLVGEKLVMVGVGNTVNVPALVTVMPVPLTRTEMVPVVAPTGTVTVSEFAVAAVTVAKVPLKRTVLLAGIVLKLVPVIVTVAPTAPLVGEKLVMVGAGTTSKLEALVTVTPLDVTEMGPSAAPAGTVTVILFAEDAVTVAFTPLKN
jgi:hypothetical protein